MFYFTTSWLHIFCFIVILHVYWCIYWCTENTTFADVFIQLFKYFLAIYQMFCKTSILYFEILLVIVIGLVIVIFHTSIRIVIVISKMLDLIINHIILLQLFYKGKHCFSSICLLIYSVQLLQLALIHL